MPLDQDQFRIKDTNKVEKKPFHEVVAEKLIEQLKQGAAPWQKPWSPGPAGSGMPMNPTTGKRYKGINAIQLMMQGHSDQRWMTYNQAAAEGAQVRKGEKGTPIQYWKFRDERNKKDESGKPVLDAKGDPVKESFELERPKVFFATVFNAEQIDGLPPQVHKEQTWNAVERAEQILQASGARILNVPGDRAFYRLSTDTITMPDKGQFESAERYYATGLHELGHWTGHPSRLDRDLSHPFGSEGYAKEELRAEIASMILGDEIGIGHDPEQHVSYVASWIKALQDDPLEIFRAAADAEKIQTLVLELEQTLIQERERAQGTQAMPLEQEQAEVLAHIEDAHKNANPGYSALESWHNLKKTAEENGYQAALRWSDGDEYDPDIRVQYTDASGQVLPIHTDLHSGDGKAVTSLNGRRLDGTGFTSDNDWQSDALNSAIATMRSRAQNQEANMEQGQALPPQVSQQQIAAEQWVLNQLAGDIKPVLGRMNERQLETVQNVLEYMQPMDNDNAFWQRHTTAAEAMFNDSDAVGERISSAKGWVQESIAAIHEQPLKPDVPQMPQLSPLELDASASLQTHRRLLADSNNVMASLHEEESLLPKLAAAFGEDMPLPATWTGGLQVRGCVETADGVEEAVDQPATFYGIYAQDADGLHMWVTDRDTKEQAQELAGRLKLIDAYSQTNENEQVAKLAQIREDQVRQDPDSTAEDISAAKESRKNAEVSAALNDSDLQRRIAELEKTQAPSEVPAGDGKQPNIAKEKTWLVVPYGEREEAKKVAGNLSNGKKSIDFDRTKKCWFAVPGADLDKLKRWMPENNQVRQEEPMSARDEFALAMKEAGLVVQGDHPIMDGQRHRVPVEGAKGKKTDGMYVLHDVKLGEKGIPAGFIANNRTGTEFKWKAKGYALSDTDKAAMQAESAANQALREAKKEARQAEVSVAIGQLLAVAPPASADHTYLKNKEARTGDLQMVPPDTSGLPEGSMILIGKTSKESKALREANDDKLVFTAGDLLLTAQNIKGGIQSVQTIRPNGTKMFAKDSTKHEGFHVVGGNGLQDLESAPVIVIGEGYATADTLSQSLGYATVAAFDSGNLPHVAKLLHGRFPNKPVLIAGDNDLHQELIDGRNPGRTKAQEAAQAVDGKAIVPIFAPGEQSYPVNLEPIDREQAKLNKLPPEQQEALNKMKKHTDFNDLATRSVLGREGLDRQVKSEVELLLQKHQTRLDQSLEQTTNQTIDNKPRRARSAGGM